MTIDAPVAETALSSVVELETLGLKKDGKSTRLPRPGTVPLAAATAAFLDRFRQQPTTRRTYADTLAALEVAAGGAAMPGEAVFTPTTAATAMTHWNERAPATWNKHLAALRSFAAYAMRQEWGSPLTQPGFWNLARVREVVV